MKKVITLAVIKDLKPGDGDVADALERNLYLRVLPSGVKAWRVRLKDPNPPIDPESGKPTRTWYWWKLGGADGLTPEKARLEAQVAKGAAAGRADPREAKRQRAKDAKRRTTLRAFLTDQYAPWVRANRKTGNATVTTIEGRCATFLDTPMVDLTPFAVEKWRSEYLKRRKKPATVNRVLVALKACLAKAVEWNVLDDHPLRKVKLGKVDRVGRLRYLSPDEEKRLLAALAARDGNRREAREHHNAWCEARTLPAWPTYGTYTDHLTPLILLLLHTGLRFGEACGLTWKDVDLTGARVTVRAETSKAARTRYVPLNTTIVDVLKAWKPKKPDADAYVFPGRARADGQAGKLTDIKTAWKELLGNVTGAPIVKFRIHDLRHTFASKLVQAGVDLNTVRELLGHADIVMTLRYAHLAPEHKAAAVAKLVAAG